MGMTGRKRLSARTELLRLTEHAERIAERVNNDISRLVRRHDEYVERMSTYDRDLKDLFERYRALSEIVEALAKDKEVVLTPTLAQLRMLSNWSPGEYTIRRKPNAQE